ncbi:MAG: nitrite reductase [Candidatus Krumholzibacteriia bacterium]
MPRRRTRRILILAAALAVAAAGALVIGWPHLINAMLPAGSRPVAMTFPVQTVDDAGFARVAAGVAADLPDRELAHVARFGDAGIRAYAGPRTCLRCHRTVRWTLPDGTTGEADLMDNLLGSAHYRFYTKAHPNVWGFDGRSADGFPMGKINRPCPKPGSFAMTAWAELVVTQRGDTLSEGCGQCHIGGQAQAPLGGMMPLYRTLAVEKDAIDCLICHAAAYDMDRKQVERDANGRLRWGQDRSLRAALSVGRPQAAACLRCHQHNLGGDIYVEEGAEEFMPGLVATGADRPRVLHPGAKRGTPFSPAWDVHAAAGLSCLDCHQTRGHLIAKGTHTTTMMANDLPDVEVSCLGCHEAPVHGAVDRGADLDAHLERLACVTCHIPSLHPDNATRRDFFVTEFEDPPGIHVYHDQSKLSGPGEGLAYVWWNGDATFLGNPIGDNPNGAGLYRFYTADHRWPEFADFDYAGWYERVMRPLAARRPSRLYAMKRFNGRQHVDLGNIGPFGGMFVPYNLPLYYRDGDPDLAAREELKKPMMGMMYGWLFKFYMLDRFMAFMTIDGWDTGAYKEALSGRGIDPRWLPNDAMLEVSHAIRREGALSCDRCHGPDGVLD